MAVMRLLTLEALHAVTFTAISAAFFYVRTLSKIIGLSLYYLLFHPLRNISGPKLAAVTPWVQLYHGLKGDRHLWLDSLHQKYGAHVRVAPNFISILSAKGLHDIYGHGKKIKKGEFYTAFQAIKGTCIKPSFLGMEDVVLDNIRNFCNKVVQQHSSDTIAGGRKAKSLSDWFSYLTFDVMGELCFGKSYGMLTGQGRTDVIRLVDRAAFRHYVCGLWTPLDKWGLDKIFIRSLTNDRWKFIQNSRNEATQRAKERMDAGRDAKKDFFYYLLNAKDPETGEGLSMKELWSESNVLMIAGSDTTSTSLCATIFYLLKNPRCMSLLKDEDRSTFSSIEDIVTGQQLNGLLYLKSCIDEAMRLAPAVPGAMPREVMAGGTTVDGIFLPEGTNCGTPCYSVHRLPNHYPQPAVYIPERWIEGAIMPCSSGGQQMVVTKESVELAREAFCPFSIGPRGCIGKGMALMELKLTLARIMWLFEIEAANETGQDVDGQFALVDHFTSQKEGPVVYITKREHI